MFSKELAGDALFWNKKPAILSVFCVSFMRQAYLDQG